MRMRIAVLVLLTLLVAGLNAGSLLSSEFRDMGQIIFSQNPYDGIFTALWQVYMVQAALLGFLWYPVLHDWYTGRKP